VVLLALFVLGVSGCNDMEGGLERALDAMDWERRHEEEMEGLTLS
jgi:hypothetical protein